MNLQKSILSTLAYHDIFDYPLKLEEISQFLIRNKSSDLILEKNLKFLINSKIVGEQANVFYLRNKKKLIQTKIKRINYSKMKYKKANFYISLLKLIPSIKLVAVTGALAMNNSTKDDDIDLLIICSKNSLWTTRFFSNLLLFPFKRKPMSKKQRDKACLNVFIDESDLKIKDQNLYTAHEIAQLKPIFDRGHTYLKFIKTNKWFYEYLPNWKLFSANREFHIEKRNKIYFPSTFKNVLENLLKHLQLKYMESKITTEKIGNKQLFFHPLSTQESILLKYKNKIKNLKI